MLSCVVGLAVALFLPATGANPGVPFDAHEVIAACRATPTPRACARLKIPSGLMGGEWRVLYAASEAAVEDALRSCSGTGYAFNARTAKWRHVRCGGN